MPGPDLEPANPVPAAGERGVIRIVRDLAGALPTDLTADDEPELPADAARH